MQSRALSTARELRARLEQGEADPASLRAALLDVEPLERDAWVDEALGIEAPPADGPALPQGGVPYLPCPVDALLRSIDQASIGASDVFIDVGSGLGRAAVLVSLLTGAAALGIEVQPELVAEARRLAARLRLDRVEFIAADATLLPAAAAAGSVFFLYCPFSGQHLEEFLDRLEPVARAGAVRLCCVDVPLPPRPWLVLTIPTPGDLAVYRSSSG